MDFAERQTEHAELLAGVAGDLTRFEEPEPLLASAFRRLSEKNEADLCCCYLAEGRQLRLSYAGGLPDGQRQGIERLAAEDSLCGQAIRQGCRTGATNIQTSQDPSLAFLKSIGAVSFYCYPLVTRKRLLGAISFGTRQAGGFGAAELEMQGAIAAQIAVGLDRILLAGELAQAKEALRRANTDLEQFAFSASHDLREPLRHLAIFSDLLNAKMSGSLDDDCRQYLSFIAGSARRIEILVRDLLAYTRAASDGPGVQLVNSNEALAHALTQLSDSIGRSNASIHASALPSIYVSPPHLEQVFVQLIENALKYRRPGAPPQVHVFALEQDGAPVFCVRDNGIGIEPAYKERVFGLFKRLHTSEEYEGTGIGLAICQKIVERYRGEIWVESKAGEGATFCFTFGKQTDGGRTVSASARLHR